MDIIRLTGGQLKTVENLSTEKVIRFDADPAVIAMDINAQRAQKKQEILAPAVHWHSIASFYYN